MTSQDVIHDLYLPALRLKQDILPDRYTYLWFNATKTGIFHFTCAEFCGTDHSVMAGPHRDHDAGRLCALDRGAAARRRSRPPGRSAVPLARLLGLPHAGLDRARARPARPLRPRRASHRRPHRDRRRSLSARLHSAAGQGRRGRLSADHAELHRRGRARARSSS